MTHEPLIRLCAFVAVLLAMAAWETLAPRRKRTVGRATRWPSNIGVVIVNTALLRLILPAGAVGFAFFCTARGWGFFNAMHAPIWLTILPAVVILDFVIYLQHVMFHAVPILWRVHRMHHADLDFDVTTGIRFHPAEIVISMGIKLAAVALFGTPAAGVLAFEVLLNATSMFNHSNIDIPTGRDAILRMFVVTPDMHRVHHSIVVRETNSNFGFNLPWWDRLLGTYRAQPEAGHDAMTIGIEQFRDARELRLDRMLTQPWRGSPGAYPING
jgi:sterol desaturase/sphingolipid hydroxylase (fatty acid hydroxylase superfamily)